MKFLFRVDAGGKIGLGHFYRSISLAETLRSRGHQVSFVHKPSSFWSDVVSSGFAFDSEELTERNQELQTIRNAGIDVFYVDAIINFETDEIFEIKEFAKVVFYQNISLSKNLADIFILPSIHQRKSFFERFSNQTKIYQGLNYLLFNPAIHVLTPKQTISDVRTISVIAGGSDPRNTLMEIHDLIEYTEFKNVEFKFYYGIDHLHKDKLYSRSNQVKFLEYCPERILKADLLISAFGVSTYEFMALGMPVMAYGHQKSNANAAQILAEKTSSLINLGKIDNITSEGINTELKRLISDKKCRMEMVESSKQLIDFNGAQRVSNILEESI